MAILVPGAGFTNVGGMWQILPPPKPGKFGIRRDGINLNIYETIGTVPITAQGNLVCPGGTPFSPTQPSPELITGITVTPGSIPNRQGNGVTVLVGGKPNIPEMLMPVYNEPYVQYGTIGPITPGLVTLVLPVSLIGYVTEKYFYDGESGFSELYKGDTTPNIRDNVRGASRDGGVGTLKTPGFKRDKKITVKDIPGSGTLPISSSTTSTETALTIGSPATQQAAANSSYVWSMKPSLIRTERLFFTITVTSTCPPYIWYFPAYMDVDNNWTPHTKRIQYRINKQKTALPGEEARF
ncbi:hypothetical protein S250808_079 [Synechococcus phage S-CAM3]|uniref:Uncharacterized protein n=1 Tax=Synechococcus phage S-CAM3 TaxID=1883366 RepID=A0A1D8KJ01_9CAUD|nr:hypothetical protein S250808_079 [Synechococcus phage S-CAM3]